MYCIVLYCLLLGCLFRKVYYGDRPQTFNDGFFYFLVLKQVPFPNLSISPYCSSLREGERRNLPPPRRPLLRNLLILWLRFPDIQITIPRFFFQTKNEGFHVKSAKLLFSQLEISFSDFLGKTTLANLISNLNTCAVSGGFHWEGTSQWFLHKLVVVVTHSAIPAIHALQHGGQ